MHVVRDLVRLDANKGRVGAVDRAVESLIVDAVQRLREGGAEAGEEVAPEGPAATDQVLP